MSHAKTIKKSPLKQPPFAPAASYMAKYLYRPLRRLFSGMNTDSAYGRLRGVLLKVMADKEGKSGRIDPLSGKLSLMEGFEFNQRNTVRQPFLKKCRSYTNENKTQGVVELDPLNPSKDIIAPPGTAYFKLFVFMIGMDHKTECHQVVVHDWMGFYSITQRLKSPQGWATQKRLEGAAILITGIGIRFYDHQLEELPAAYDYEERRELPTHSLVIHKALPW